MDRSKSSVGQFGAQQLSRRDRPETSIRFFIRRLVSGDSACPAPEGVEPSRPPAAWWMQAGAVQKQRSSKKKPVFLFTL